LANPIKPDKAIEVNHRGTESTEKNEVTERGRRRKQVR
jgi:hypothetical protein